MGPRVKPEDDARWDDGGLLATSPPSFNGIAVTKHGRNRDRHRLHYRQHETATLATFNTIKQGRHPR
ncbi:MAG: hypothetical protein ABJD38_10350, partial [Aurantimonas coralicida]